MSEKKTNWKKIIVNILLVGLPKVFSVLNNWLEKKKVELDQEETKELKS